jgi:1,4-alpha-glucan branching enzyme
MEKGYFSLVLHAHLPFVRHPEYEFFMEEHWLFEAITETYIPLLQVFENLEKEGIHFQITMSLSPTLISMLVDPLLQERYVRHLDKLIELAEKEIDRTKFDERFHPLALMYYKIFTKSRELFVEQYNCNLVNGFKRFWDSGALELITVGATHGFLPLMFDYNSAAARAQIETAVKHHEKYLGRKPEGIWLPECGYTPGVEKLLKEAGIKYFFVDTHGILHAEPRPRYGVFAPIYTPDGVAVFGRDVETSKQVWSAVEGYPGDFDYREFYRDIGFDLPMDYIKPYIHPDGIRMNTGIKYYKITGKTDDKEPYNPKTAREKAAMHAGHFLFNREQQVQHLYDVMGGRKPIVVAMYDAELFGHWWYEGPMFIEYLYKKFHYDQNTIRPITPNNYLIENPTNQVATPSMSSWGYKGYAEFWLNENNDWIYPHLHKAADRMSEVAVKFYDTTNEVEIRVLNQMARELLLAQASDWAFIMQTGTVVPYAVNRTREHLTNFNQLYEDLLSGKVDIPFLESLEAKHNLFPDMDFHVYAHPVAG